jgi:hypothetical protein
MDTLSTYDEERIAELLRSLPPAPRGWVRAAHQLPAARAEIDRIVDLAEKDARYRSDVLADLAEALRAAGVEPERRAIERLRSRLED